MCVPPMQQYRACIIDSQGLHVLLSPLSYCIHHVYNPALSCLLSFLHHPYIPLCNLKNFTCTVSIRNVSYVYNMTPLLITPCINTVLWYFLQNTETPEHVCKGTPMHSSPCTAAFVVDEAVQLLPFGRTMCFMPGAIIPV